MSDHDPRFAHLEKKDGRRKRIKPWIENPLAEAISSKFVKGTKPRRYDAKGNRIVDEPAYNLINKVSNATSNSVTDSESLLQLLPDIKLVMKILVSSILAPHDLITSDINYSIEGDDIEAGPLTTEFITILKDHFETTYRIKPLLPRMLEDILMKKGSYPMVILPEASIDELINSGRRVSVEDFSEVYAIEQGKLKVKNIGILGEPRRAGKKDKNSVSSGVSLESFATFSIDSRVNAFESFHDKLFYSVTDNPHVLRTPIVLNEITNRRAREVLSKNQLSLEAFSEGAAVDRMTEQAFDNSIYGNRNFEFNAVKRVRPLSQINKDNVGHPLVMTLPPESIIPVHVPGAPEEHVGYFIVLDQTGHPICTAEHANHYEALGRRMIGKEDPTAKTISQLYLSTYGANSGDNFDYEQLVAMYSEMVENDLLDRLKEGIYGNTVTISRPEQIYRVMLSRALQKQQTRLLYVPASMVVYMAFDYTHYGTGKSLLEDTRIIASLRAVTLFANTMANVKNSISRVKLAIELDEEDPDPSRTVEFLLHEYAKTRQGGYPVGVANPADLINFLQNAGVSVEVSGNSAYPETKMLVEDHSSSKVPVDTELEDSLKHRHYAGLGVAPELVDSLMSADFATSIVASNIQLTKEVVLYQGKFTPFIERFMRIYTVSSSVLMDRLRAAIEKHKDKLPDDLKGLSVDKLIIELLDRLRVKLPEPNTVVIENQFDSYTKYSQTLEEVINAYITPEFINDMNLGNEAGQSVDAVRAVLISYFKRRWIHNNNLLPEVENTLLNREEEFDLLEYQSDYINNISKSLMRYIKENLKRANKNDKAIDAIHEKLGDEEREDDASADDTGGDVGDEEETGDDFGDDDMDDVDTEEEPEDTTEEEEDEEVEEEEPASETEDASEKDEEEVEEEDEKDDKEEEKEEKQERKPWEKKD